MLEPCFLNLIRHPPFTAKLKRDGVNRRLEIVNRNPVMYFSIFVGICVQITVFIFGLNTSLPFGLLILIGFIAAIAAATPLLWLLTRLTWFVRAYEVDGLTATVRLPRHGKPFFVHDRLIPRAEMAAFVTPSEFFVGRIPLRVWSGFSVVVVSRQTGGAFTAACCPTHEAAMQFAQTLHAEGLVGCVDQLGVTIQHRAT